MPGTPSSKEQIAQIVAEVEELVRQGVKPSEAKAIIRKRWNKGESVMRGYTRHLKDSDFNQPADLGPVNVPVSPDAAKLPVPLASVTMPVFGFVPHTEINIDPAIKCEPKRSPNTKTFIITGWEVRVRPDFGFIDCLRQIAKAYGASMYLAPHYLPDLDFLPPELRSCFKLLTEDLHLNDNLMFRFVETHALASSPLTGWKGVSEKTQIIPGLIKQLQTYPTDNNSRQAVTTGSVGYLTLDSEHYKFIANSSDKAYKARFDSRWNGFRSQKKPTAIASEFVMPSALIVHVIDDRRFLIRRVTMQPGNDHVFDLNKRYSAGRKSPQTIKPAALNIGDTHAWFADPVAMRCTTEQIDELTPSIVITNDFFDGCSSNHHEKDRPFTFRQAPPISVEAKYTEELLTLLAKKTAKGTRCVDLHSNHHDFLEKFLDAGEKYWSHNYNYEVCVDLQQRRMSTKLHPIQLLIDYKKTGFEFWPDTEPLRVGKVAVLHGHQPVSGKRAGFVELAKNFNYLSSNHTHSPAEFRNAVCGGLTGIREMAYTEGSMNGWLHANTLIHSDGSMQLLSMIDGLWMI